MRRRHILGSEVVDPADLEELVRHRRDADPEPYSALIDGSKAFVSNSIRSLLPESPDSNQSLAYYVVSTLGRQNSGKSTLSNVLFKTQFPTLPIGSERVRTTLGIHVSASTPGWLEGVDLGEESGADASLNQRDDPRAIVLDLEGCDSFERYVDDDNVLQYRLALLAFASSDIILLNLNANDVGSASSSNLQLLDICFRLHLNAFIVPTVKALGGVEAVQRKMILVVIRDVMESWKGVLEGQLEKQIASVWAQAVSGLSGAELADDERDMRNFFEVRVHTLPLPPLERDRVLSEEFIEEALCLREVFVQWPAQTDPLADLEEKLKESWKTIQTLKHVAGLKFAGSLITAAQCKAVALSLKRDYETLIHKILSQLRKAGSKTALESLKVTRKDEKFEGELENVLIALREALLREYRERTERCGEDSSAEPKEMLENWFDGKKDLLIAKLGQRHAEMGPECSWRTYWLLIIVCLVVSFAFGSFVGLFAYILLKNKTGEEVVERADAWLCSMTGIPGPNQSLKED